LNTEIWRYNGTWSKVPDPLPADWDDKSMSEAGWNHADDYGTPGLGDIELYEHRVEQELWIIFWSPGHNSVIPIEVTGAPNLMDSLSKLSIIGLSSQMHGLESTLAQAVWVMSEDGKHEWRIRHPELPKTG